MTWAPSAAAFVAETICTSINSEECLLWPLARERLNALLNFYARHESMLKHWPFGLKLHLMDFSKWTILRGLFHGYHLLQQGTTCLFLHLVCRLPLSRSSASRSHINANNGTLIFFFLSFFLGVCVCLWVCCCIWYINLIKVGSSGWRPRLCTMKDVNTNSPQHKLGTLGKLWRPRPPVIWPH